MHLQEMMLEQKAALDKANAIVTAAETAGRGLTANETADYNTSMAAYKSLGVTV